MNIILLTHEHELNKKTNTGSIAVKHAANIVERIVWQRTTPSEKLVKLIDDGQALLLYPAQIAEKPCLEDQKTDECRIKNFEYVVIIDSTWQQSRKIYNKSAYLQKMPKATLNTRQPSRYQLRRNQTQGGLCTIECIIEVLNAHGNSKLASHLVIEFDKLNSSAG